MSTSFMKPEVLCGNKFYKSTSFIKPELLYGNKFYEARSLMWQQVLIDNKFYIATCKCKQVFFYKATNFTSDGKCSIFENKFYLR